MSFTLAIVGRPNVGKSTLFNRLAGKKLALVHDAPGVTRDRRFADASVGELNFRIIDTAGLEEANEESLEGRMRAQTDKAIEEADLLLFLIDARSGLLPADIAFATLLRKSGTPVILVANKMEGQKAETGFYEACKMGFGEPIPLSAEHGMGMRKLFDELAEKLEPDISSSGKSDIPEENSFVQENRESVKEISKNTRALPNFSGPMRIAVIGRPNVGKSTLINQMTGDNHLITGPEAGLTRDSIAIDWQWQEKKICLYDTAGMRKKARIQQKLERLSVSDSLRAVQFAEVVIIVFDATIPFEKQDLQISDLVIREGRAPVIAVNKWDLVKNHRLLLAELRKKSEQLLPQVKGLKIMPVSATTGEGISQLMKTVMYTYQKWNQRIATARLNKWLEGVTHCHEPPAVRGQRVRLKFITQAKSRPPTFMVSCSRPDCLPAAYSRYMINNLRETFDLYAVPVRMFFRKSSNPYVKARKQGSRHDHG